MPGSLHPTKTLETSPSFFYPFPDLLLGRYITREGYLSVNYYYRGHQDTHLIRLPFQGHCRCHLPTALRARDRAPLSLDRR